MVLSDSQRSLEICSSCARYLDTVTLGEEVAMGTQHRTECRDDPVEFEQAAKRDAATFLPFVLQDLALDFHGALVMADRGLAQLPAPPATCSGEAAPDAARPPAGLGGAGVSSRTSGPFS